MLHDSMRVIMMEVTIHVPANTAARWQSQGDLPRDVLEGTALEANRKRIIGLP